MFIVVAGSGTGWPDVQVCGSGVALYVPGSGRVGSGRILKIEPVQGSAWN